MEMWKILFTATGVSLSFLLIAFRQRQLYLLLPKFYEYSTLTDSGKVVEIAILNRGWLMEEDIILELPPKMKIELVASDALGVEHERSALIMPRLAQRSEARLILLIEGAGATSDIFPKLTSKTSKGKLVKAGSIPPNYGVVALLLVGYLGLMAGLSYGNSILQSKIAEMDRDIENKRARLDELQKASDDRKLDVISKLQETTEECVAQLEETTKVYEELATRVLSCAAPKGAE